MYRGLCSLKGKLHVFRNALHTTSHTAQCLHASRIHTVLSGISDEVSNFEFEVMDVPGQIAEDLSDMLLAEGAVSCSVREFRGEGMPEQEIFADKDSNTPKVLVWDQCTVVACFSSSQDGIAQDENEFSNAVDRAMTYVGLDPVKHQRMIHHVKTQDWAQNIKDSYQPCQVKPGLWIIPSWSKIVDINAINIILEPGLAFGTGDHPTTRLCLSWLYEEYLQGAIQGKRVLDYGTGSGVLAIASLLMGASFAEGTDVEHLSIKAATYNAELNNTATQFISRQCAPCISDNYNSNEDDESKYDIIIANILKGPLMELAPVLASYASFHGTTKLGLSGITTSQVANIIAAYSPYVQNFTIQNDGEWAFISGVFTPK